MNKLKLFSLISLFSSSFLILTSCNKANEISKSKIPVYQGMIITQQTDRKLISKEDSSENVDDSSEEENDFDDEEELENDIEDLVEIDVAIDDEIKYYVAPGEVFDIEIHLSNPYCFEIQSFTLNNKKYANYMFKEGSDMETLILETYAPDTPGYINYSIDAIKYIDGTDIKDVDMSEGDKSIKAGIKYSNYPSATLVEDSIFPDKAELTIDVRDSDSLIERSSLLLYLSDGQQILQKKELNVGSNKILFDNLNLKNKYQYGVVATFDFVDGRDSHSEWLLKNEFSTKSALEIVDIKTSKTAISFEINKFYDSAEISKICLHDSETNVLISEAVSTTREFTNLYSNHSYNIFVYFSFIYEELSEESFVCEKNIYTVTKAAPKLFIENLQVNDFSINADLKIEDNDSICAVDSVNLYKDMSMIATNKEKIINFGDLKSNTEYTIMVFYNYDLNDGLGTLKDFVSKTVKTTPHIELLQTYVINTSPVSEGDTIYIEAHALNPDNAAVTFAIINGKQYEVDKASSKENLFINIVIDGQFIGGETELIIDELIVELNGEIFNIKINQKNKANVFINGAINVVDLSFCDSSNKAIKYATVGSELDLLLKVENPSKYNIYKCNLGQVEMIDYSTVKIILSSALSIGQTTLQLTSFNYKNEYVDKVFTGMYFSNPISIVFDGINYINKADDFLNLKNNCYYELSCDIDFEGKEWIGTNFKGVINGNNHNIQNMRCVRSFTNLQTNIGLFSIFSGVAENLHFSNCKYIVSSDSDVALSAGFLAGMSDSAFVENIIVEKNCVLSAKGFDAIGSIIGRCYELPETNFIINRCINNSIVSSDCVSGGLIGKFQNCIAPNGLSSLFNIKISNSFNVGHIISNDFASGLIGTSSYKSSILLNCYNDGIVESENYATGLIITGGSLIQNCFNSGELVSQSYCYGITNDPVTLISNSFTTKIYQPNDVLIEKSMIYTKEFFIDTLLWDVNVWNFDVLDAEKNILPTLNPVI